MTQIYLNYLYLSIGIILAVSLLLWWGWRGRRRRQAHLPAPDTIPDELIDAEPLAAGEGMVIGTVKASDYLDRIAVHGLGIRTDGRIEVHDQGVAVFRAGAPNFMISGDQLLHARTDRGVVGKFVERDGALIVGWVLGGETVETAFRARHGDAHEQLLSHLKTLTEE